MGGRARVCCESGCGMAYIHFTQSGPSVPLAYQEGAVDAARAVLDVQVPEEQSQRLSLGHAQLPLAPGVAGVGAGVVLRRQRAGLGAQRRMSTTITWNKFTATHTHTHTHAG